eukprot:11997557-Karenia_brevis.AAC.1
MREVCPCDVVEMFMRDAEAVLWAEWTQRDEYRPLAPAPFLQPALSLVSARRNGWSVQHASAARQAITHGAVTQQVLHGWGWTDDPRCQACLQAIGDASHRYHLCPERRLHRWCMTDTRWQHVAQVAVEGRDPA